MSRLRAAGSAPAAVDRFLAVLDGADRELFLEGLEHARSGIEIWTLAVVLGYDGPYGDLVQWAQTMHPIEDRRAILAEEAGKLRDDIVNVRKLLDLTDADSEKIYTRVSTLSKELRGHLVEVEKMSKAIDRRGLLLAGADRVMREVRSAFVSDPDIQDVLASVFKAVWASLSEEG